MNNVITEFEGKIKKSLTNLENEYTSLRAGRANPHMLDKITIDYFGTQTPLNQVGNISVPEARMIQIQPWDAAALKLIEKAIQTSDLGVNPTNDGSIIRIILPELTEERRKSLTKDIKKKGEDCKVGIRNLRRDAIDNLKKLEKSKEIAEDERKKLEDLLQKSTDKSGTQIDKMVDDKNKEILSI